MWLFKGQPFLITFPIFNDSIDKLHTSESVFNRRVVVIDRIDFSAFYLCSNAHGYISVNIGKCLGAFRVSCRNPGVPVPAAVHTPTPLCERPWWADRVPYRRGIGLHLSQSRHGLHRHGLPKLFSSPAQIWLAWRMPLAPFSNLSNTLPSSSSFSALYQCWNVCTKWWNLQACDVFRVSACVPISPIAPAIPDLLGSQYARLLVLFGLPTSVDNHPEDIQLLLF